MKKINFEMKEEDLEKVLKASKLVDRTKSSFFRFSALKYAEKVLEIGEEVNGTD